MMMATAKEILELTGGWQAAPVGSRVTCNPAPLNTDEDWLVRARPKTAAMLARAGFVQDGSPEFYTGNDNGGFRPFRRGDLNIVTTECDRFFKMFGAATALAKRFNLLEKADRIALFQAVLYGVGEHDLKVVSAPGCCAELARELEAKGETP